MGEGWRSDNYRREEIRDARVDAAGREHTAAWPGGIPALTLFVEDLAVAKHFYREVFALPVFFEDDNSAVFNSGDTLVNLLKSTEAHDLIAPARVGSPDAGARFQLTLAVDDVDAMCRRADKRAA